jgi:hypothetical protein
MNEYRDLVKEAERLTDCIKVTQGIEACCNPNNLRELEQIKVLILNAILSYIPYKMCF